MTLDLDLNTITVAAVKATVDGHLESIWRASGVRILRNDLPFCGIRLRYQNQFLAMDRVLSNCKVVEKSTLYAQWPQKSEKDERRKRYGKGWDDEPVLKRRSREEREGKRAEKAMREAAKKESSKVVENTTSSAPDTSGDGQASNEWASDERPDDKTEVEPEGGCAGAGGEEAHGLSEELAEEEQDEQLAEQQEQEQRPTGEVTQDDPFADEDDDKENREPQFAPVVENRADDQRAEEWLGFDESNSGLGVELLEDVLEF